MGKTTKPTSSTGSKPTAKKKAAAKKVAKQPVAKQAAVKKAAATKPGTKKKVVTKKAAARQGDAVAVATQSTVPRLITAAQRHRLIAEAAYLRAEAQGFFSDEREDWLIAEAEVDARLVRAGIVVRG